MERWHSLWPQKVTGSLEVTVAYFMTLRSQWPLWSVWLNLWPQKVSWKLETNIYCDLSLMLASHSDGMLKSFKRLSVTPLRLLIPISIIDKIRVGPSHQWHLHVFRDWILLVCFSWRYEATEVPRVNFVMREALFEIYTWILCRFIPSWETNK